MTTKRRSPVFIGADHRGFELKAEIMIFLKKLGHEVIDAGSYDVEPCDYPPIAYEVASQVARLKKGRGILVCMSGIGHSIAANKVPGAYAALCYNKEAAILSRQHNNANVLVLGSKFVAREEIFEIIKVWLSTEFEGGRHLRRTRQIAAMEKKLFKDFQ
ncbi:MAG: ribose 5-phosphate isomerase B [Candidatus Omnitrophota bacterium]